MTLGKEPIEQYLQLKRKVVEENHLEKKKSLIKELSNLGDKYNFE